MMGIKILTQQQPLYELISNLIEIFFGNFGNTISVTKGRFDYFSVSCDVYRTNGGIAYKNT